MVRVVLGKLPPGRLSPRILPPTLTLTKPLALTQGEGGLLGDNLPAGNFPVTNKGSCFLWIICLFPKLYGLFIKWKISFNKLGDKFLNLKIYVGKTWGFSKLSNEMERSSRL